MCARRMSFFYNDTATTEIYTLSLHDALPISDDADAARHRGRRRHADGGDADFTRLHARIRYRVRGHDAGRAIRSEEHTSELQSQSNLVCRPLPGKKKKSITQHIPPDRPTWRR